MDIYNTGNLLEEFFRMAQQELVIAAPFIKVNALERLVKLVPPSTSIICITRWRIEEIVNGISDIEIWQLLNNRPKTELLLRSDLHAKYYRCDNKWLIGSANISNSALGWSLRPNFEILVSPSQNKQQLFEFENQLLSGCVKVDDSIYKYILQMLNSIEEKPKIPFSQIDSSFAMNFESFSSKPISSDKWLPTLRNPNILYKAYCSEFENLTQTQKEFSLLDLAALPLSEGLTKDNFIMGIGILLLQKPIIEKVDKFLEKSQRFGAVKDFLNCLPCSSNPNFDANDAWQTLMRWMLYFLPLRYNLITPKHSEVIQKTNYYE